VAQRTHEECPSDPEATYVEARVEAASALFDGLEDAGVPLR